MMKTIPAGTEFRDDQGRLVATLVGDLHPGSVLLPSHFKMADGSAPVVGQQIPRPILNYLQGQQS